VHRTAVRAFVAITLITASTLSAAEGEKKPPRYHLNVIEYTNAGYYGDDLNDRGQAARSGPLPDEPFSMQARRWSRGKGSSRSGRAGASIPG
jgi:hypothetical protein